MNTKLHNTTSRAAILLLAVVGLVPLAVGNGGCGATVTPSPFYNGVAEQYPPIGRQFRAYVEADNALRPIDRTQWINAADTMDDLIRREGIRLAPTTAPANATP